MESHQDTVKPHWQGQEALLPLEQAEVYVDGTFSEPRLAHPEGLAFDAAGVLWCGGEHGEIYRIGQRAAGLEGTADLESSVGLASVTATGSSAGPEEGNRKIACVASTGGFTLGLAFGPEGQLFTCDLRWKKVFRYTAASGQLSEFAEGDGNGRSLAIPNVPLVDAGNRWLYVSDSHDPKHAGPGIWRFDLDSGQGGIWCEEAMRFANGMALHPAGDAIWVAETFARTISRVPVLPDGSCGKKEAVLQVPALPDGLAFDRHGRLYISCYEPSLLYRWSEGRGLELLYYDPEAHMLCHPTNCAFQGGDLYTSNLGRWHITRIRGVEELD